MPNHVDVGAEGPYHAASASLGDTEAAEVWLCRCGQSANKPHCDGSHKKAAFADPGVYEVGETADVSYTALRVDARPNGPLLISGGVEVRDAAGTVIFSGAKTALCRCGASQSKPFCDASHKASGFIAP